MGVSQGKHHRVLALELSPVADADNLQLFTPALGHAVYGVVDQGAHQAVDRCALVVLAHDLNVSVRRLQFHTRRQMRLHLPLGPLHDNGVALDFKFHSLREWDRFVSDTGHNVESFSIAFRRSRSGFSNSYVSGARLLRGDRVVAITCSRPTKPRTVARRPGLVCGPGV